ncbi:MAG: NUDIX domain-containing protein [Candidatus Methanomethyliaceae archaeon]|nr:NUDIX domain-containing protein [Candidatus Methanomethyliaceae archaeon]MDW7970272.1 NUDIX domain-containing protein [Nitrososphaerota archaeon]
MKREKSAGFLIFRRQGDDIKYLFLINKGKYDIPKGLQMPEEDELKTALRELEEETGIKDVKIIPFFRKKAEYHYKWAGESIKKEVVYFLGEIDRENIIISEEHDGYIWMNKDEALSKLKYENLKDLVISAEKFIRGMKNE